MEAGNKRERRVVKLCGKSSTLSPSSVFEVANRLADFTIDSSWLSKTTRSYDPATAMFCFSIPDYLTEEEARASVLVFLNKLLLSSTSVDAINRISDILLGSDLITVRSVVDYVIEVSPSDIPSLDYSVAVLEGISALLDYKSSGLANVADAVASLSCEAMGAGVCAFNVVDSGDGSSSKDEVSVAAHFRKFFNGSKLVNFKVSDSAVSDIPVVHGLFREICRALHSSTRVGLSSGFKIGSAVAVSKYLIALAIAVIDLVESSFRRVKLVLDSIANVEIRSILEAQRPNSLESLEGILVSAQASRRKKDYVQFSHQVSGLVDEARKVIFWEATVSFVSLEGYGMVGNIQKDVPTLGEKTGEKRKKVLGKGSSVLMQFVKDVLPCGDFSKDAPALMARLSQDFFSLLDPKGFHYEGFLKKVKDIVESNDSRRRPKIPKGTRDFAKEQMAIRERAFAIIVGIFKRHGATALDTPTFELRETLMGKYGEDSKLIYDLVDQGGEVCSLRYDLTVPFARYVAMNGCKSSKCYRIANVFRRDNPSKGRYREFCQCDFDIAGHFEKMAPDFEVLKTLTELLNELQIGDYEIKVNHRMLLDGMLAICGVPQEKFRTICSSIDKLDKQPFEQIKKEMIDVKGLNEESADAIGALVSKRGSPWDLLQELKKEGSKFLDNAEASLALNELEILFDALEKSNCIQKMVFDLSLARGLDYYTGVIFEAVVKGSTEVGSIASGGRYDNLIGMFGTEQVPAVGMSLGIERVILILEQLVPDQVIRPTETDVLVSILGNDLSLGANLVSQLWDAKIKAELLIDKRMKKHTEYAIQSGIPWRVIVGQRELDAGILKLKNAKTKEEFDIPITRLVEEVSQCLTDASPSIATDAN